MGFELTTLVVIGTDCIGSIEIQLPYDHNHDSPEGGGGWNTLDIDNTQVMGFFYNFWQYSETCLNWSALELIFVFMCSE